MKFVMSYSCGKDSTMALHKMIEAGHEPIGLVVMVNEAVNRSYFHGADQEMLDKYAKALGLPMIQCPTNGEDYHLAFEAGLKKAKEQGAEAVGFGDIDLDGNRKWEEDRCDHVGLTPFFPLWQCSREENVDDIMRLGYKCLIKSINNTILPKELLGRYIDEESVEMMRVAGIDVCGENGEYHTLAVDGPIFKEPLDFQTGKIMEFGDYSTIEVW